MSDKLVAFLNEHGLAGLTNIKKTRIEKKDVYILNYEHILFDKNGMKKDDPILCKCRNLVVREESPNNWLIMAQSFRRFFNWEEDVEETKLFTEALRAGQVTASEKFDGSLITITYFDDQWHVFTRGSDADANPFRGMSAAVSNESDGETFGLFTRRYIDVNSLDKAVTYIFELCTPLANVTRYKEQFLALLSANVQGVELDIREVHKTLPAHIRLPETLTPSSIEELQKHLETKPEDFEGYVLKHTDGNGIIHRMKLKTLSYIKLHNTRSKQFTDEDIITAIAKGEVDEILTYMPEYKDRFDAISKKLTDIALEVDDFMAAHKDLSRGDFARLPMNKQYKWLCFELYDKKYPDALACLYANQTKTAKSL